MDPETRGQKEWVEIGFLCFDFLVNLQLFVFFCCFRFVLRLIPVCVSWSVSSCHDNYLVNFCN